MGVENGLFWPTINEVSSSRECIQFGQTRGILPQYKRHLSLQQRRKRLFWATLHALPFTASQWMCTQEVRWQLMRLSDSCICAPSAICPHKRLIYQAAARIRPTYIHSAKKKKKSCTAAWLNTSDCGVTEIEVNGAQLFPPIKRPPSWECGRGGGRRREGCGGGTPSSSFTLSLFLARRAVWNQFLQRRFRPIYIFQFIYTHYREIARGRGNLGTCNIKPLKIISCHTILLLNWYHQLSGGKWNISGLLWSHASRGVMHCKNVFPPHRLFRKSYGDHFKGDHFKEKKNVTYDMLNADIFLMKERVNERINCSHGEARSDRIQFCAKRDVNTTLHWPR